MKRYVKKFVKSMMKRRKDFKRITTTAALGTTTMFAYGQFRPAHQHFVIPVENVARTISATFAARGIQVTSDQVRLPEDVLSTEENPILEVGTVGKLGQLSIAQPGQESASIRLHCKAANTCTPFFAIVSWQGDQQSLITPPKAAGRIALPQLAMSASAITDRLATPAEILTATTQQAQQSRQIQQIQQDRPASIVKAGAPMTLMMEGDHAHIRLAVVSCASGSLGQTIRVASPDHKHFYMAEVQSADSVKGSF